MCEFAPFEVYTVADPHVSVPRPLVGRKVVEEMEEYYKSLKPEALERYLFKLQCARLSLTEDPYLIKKYSKDMRQWPTIQYGHIFIYFIKRPGIYTEEELLSWKQLESYNYYQSGYVRTIHSHLFNKNGKKCVVLKALVNPSQRDPKQAHEAWVIAKPDGRIMCCHCTCAAG